MSAPDPGAARSDPGTSPDDPGPAPDFADRALRRRKREDAAVAIPALGVLLLCSPLVNIVAGPSTVFGLPAAYAYVFAVWLGLILLTRSLAQHLDQWLDDPQGDRP